MWIFITLFAAACQSVRTAHQNTLARESGFLHATMARSLYALPLVAAYLLVCILVFGSVSLPTGSIFFIVASVCALAQIMATYFMLRVFQSGSFALGTLLAKTEAVLAALIGLPLLHYGLSAMAWWGIAFGVFGALVMSIKWKNLANVHQDASLMFGLGSGLCFAITSVMASMASHSLKGSIMTSAGVTLLYVLLLQSGILCALQIVKTRNLCAPFKQNAGLSFKVGMLSGLGSIGWFTAFSLVNPAMVKTLGQLEILGTLYYSKYRFSERITARQWFGGAMIVISVILVTAATV
ncbi:DMT family transporter [Marinomonas arenicola]|uniref:DMT family transporter n=1 Tax=Marinomonas TaxID=28253 RepID=UPI001056AFF5|nr:DMT family transporter [Marinomonas sp. KMM3893]